MLKIGITGGIGSGKTTVCRLFERLGIPVYYADDRAKALMVENLAIKNALLQAFGEETYFANGSLNRAYLSAIVFNDKNKLAVLNSLTHTIVIQDSIEWHFQQKNVPYTLKEAALLIESKSYLQLDKLILVTAPLEMRIERVVRRDNTPPEAVCARIAQQLSDDEKRAFADFFIENDGSRDLETQVLTIHQILSKKI
ncbi:MAG: hypothetical protein RI894_1561 [Bacteroidota bacterium]|jgi:dephospho-CoA kinase